MKNRFFTIVIIPEKSAKVRKIIIPRLTIQILGLISGVLILVLGIILLDYSTLLKKVLQSQEIYEQNQTLRLNYDKMQNRMTSIEATMDRMKTFATKLRTIVNLPTSSPQATSSPEYEVAATAPSDVPLIDNTGEQLGALEENTVGQEAYLQKTYELLQDKTAILMRTPSILPSRGWIASTFGYRYHPFHGKWTMHEGLDIAAYTGTKVVSSADGVVTYSGNRGGFGNIVVIDHGYGITTVYAHNSQLYVKVGQIVKRGEKISAVGSSGSSTGPHLHYEIRINDVPVDPTNYILSDQNLGIANAEI